MTEQTITLPRALVDTACNGFVQEQGHALNKIRELLAAPQPKVCECPPGTDRAITQGGHFPACTACKRRLP